MPAEELTPNRQILMGKEQTRPPKVRRSVESAIGCGAKIGHLGQTIARIPQCSIARLV